MGSIEIFGEFFNSSFWSLHQTMKSVLFLR